MAGKVLELRFPAAGVSRRLGFDSIQGARGAHGTPWTVNMRPEDPVASRRRGGSRPGLAAFTDSVPTMPSARLETEDGTPIWTETNDEILMPVTGTTVEYPAIMQALHAFGVASLPEIAITTGSAPTSPEHGCVWRNRLVLTAGGVVYFSKQGDWSDWDYGCDVENQERACMLQPAEANELAATVTALIPNRDQTLLIATKYGLWCLSGDPAANGTLTNVSRFVGVQSDRAWCKAGDTVYFLSDHGLYSVRADGHELKDLSGDKLPDELRSVDTTTVDIFLGHNYGDSGVFVFLEGGDYHWYFDLEAGGFWPFTLPKTITAVFAVDSRMVLQDNVGLYWTFDGDDDGGADIESHLLLGPFRPGSATQFGIVNELHGAVDTTGSVSWAIFVGDTAEDVAETAKSAIESYLAGDLTAAMENVFASGAWSGGRSKRCHPRSRGMWQVLWLWSEDPWAYETVVAEVQPFGRWR
jgi:hypothetical protein